MTISEVDKTMLKPSEKITKTYPSKGQLRQYRFEKTVSFLCFRCGQTKTAKLIAIFNNDWTKRLCNGCYGLLLSQFTTPHGHVDVENLVKHVSNV